MSRDQQQSRRVFVASLAGGIFGMLGLPLRVTSPDHCGHARSPGPHPEPRAGVDASRVLTAEQLGGDEYVTPIYDGIREIPHIADGIRCACGCADLPGFRSLLTCFEENGMAMACEICQTEGRFVYRLFDAGRTLDQIRTAVTARFG